MAHISARPDKSFRSVLLGLLFLVYALATLSLTLFLITYQPQLMSLPQVSEPPEFVEIVVIDERKQAFFDYFLPIIAVQNQHYAQIRRQLLQLDQRLRDGKTLTPRQRRLFDKIAARYPAQDEALPVSERLQQLLLRVDELPPSLVLAQAATESAWGTSRFAREGNNFFGQWCFKPGCGLLPHARAPGKRHELATFANAEAAVAAYFHNINKHKAYAEVRRLRAELRQQQLPLRGEALVSGLQRYSERGGAYIRDLRALINNNKLHQYD